jgi:glutamine synthetase
MFGRVDRGMIGKPLMDTMTNMKTKASMVTPGLGGEAEVFLSANPDVASIHLVWTDLCGVQRGKFLRRDELAPAWRDGRFFPISALVLDVTGQDVPETGLVWDEGDRDLLFWPVSGTLARIPWSAAPAAQYIAHIRDTDGSLHYADPRNLLSRMVERLRELRLSAVGAVELEFFLVDRDAALAGTPQAPRSLISGARAQHYQAYCLQDLDDFSPFFNDLYAFAEIQDLPAKTLISEYAPGQMEIVLRHRTDILKAADESIMLKRLIKAVAEKHGLIATFMAKPYAQWTGCGMHVHVSLADDAGRNVFAAANPASNELLLHALGGLMATMADATLMFAPNANSYRRFRRNSYAPVTVSWGIDNRTVSLRIPAGSPDNCRIEHRPAGADANPYLVLAAVLAGIHYGITHKKDPGPPLSGNGYEQSAGRIPSNWNAAIEALTRSDVLREYFGEKFIDCFCTLKEIEADRFNAEPTPRDFAWYLRTV